MNRSLARLWPTKRILWRTALALAGAALCVVPCRAAEIHLRATAAVSDAVIQLGDIADISTDNASEAATLEAINIGPAPAAGSVTRIEFATLRSRLAACGVNLARTGLSGSSQVVVSGPSAAGAGLLPGAKAPRPADERALASQQKRAEGVLGEAIRGYLQRTVPNLGKYTLAVHLDRNDVPTVLAGAATGFEIRGGQAPWDLPQRFLIRTLDASNMVREVTIECRLSPLPYVLAMKHTVPKGQILQSSDLVWRQTDSTDGVLRRPEDVIGRETQRAIRQDELVQSDDIRAVPLVRNNDVVTVFVRVGGIEVKRPMKAKSDGSAGETVTLTTLDGRQTLVGLVTGYHEAEAIGSGAAAPLNTQDAVGQIEFVAGRQE